MAIQFSMRQTDILGRLADGFYKDRYTVRATGETKHIAETQFETAYARWAFPCLDEPGLKATFSFRIGRSQDVMSLGNMPLLSSDQPVEGYPGYVWDEYDEAVVMSTYLVAFAVGEFASIVSEPLPNGVVFTTWARPDAIADGLADYAGVIGPQTLGHFQDVLGIDYPLPKMDQIALPGQDSAMENWGLTIYIEHYLLIDRSQSGDADRWEVASTVVHELAHQWFGNLVTTHWWTDLWLNEGLAEYMTFVGVEHIEPEMRSWDIFYAEEMRQLLKQDALPSAAAMLDEIHHPEETEFGLNVYNRGATMIRMIEHFLTRPTLFEGLRQYLTAFSYSNVVTDDLWFYLNRAGHSDGTLGPQFDLRVIMDTWLKQKNYPLLTVTRNYVSGMVTLTQQRFLTKDDTSGDAHNYQWYIPLTYTLVGEGETDFNSSVTSNFFLEPESILNFGVGVNDHAAIFNIQSSGYYRVNYDAENWNRIRLILQSDNFEDIHEINRAQILYDTFALALSGIESYDLPLQMFVYLDRERAYAPMSTAVYIFRQLNDMSSELPDSGLQLRTYLLTLLTTRYDEVGIEENLSATFLENMYQKQLVKTMCSVDLPACVADSIAMFGQWMLTPTPEVNNPVNKQIRRVVYCTAVRHGGQGEYDFLQGQLEKSFDPQGRRALSSALACSQDADNLMNQLSKKYKVGLIKAIKDMAENPLGRRIAWKWLTKHCKTMDDLMVTNAVRGLIEGMVECECKQEEDINAFNMLLDACQVNGDFLSSNNTFMKYL